jgi:predicted transcriptional regulator
MKVLSIKQPWASLIINGYKQYEFRSWATKYRGELYIHASKAPDKKVMKHFEKLGLDYPLGCIIGKVDLKDCLTVTKQFEDELIKSNELVYGLSKGREGYAWKIENAEKIENIYVNGKLSIWEYKK